MNSNDIDRFKFSFRNAFAGIQTAYRTQKNLKIHMFIGLIMITAGFLLNITNSDWLILILTIMLVIISELFNTALEFTVDLFSPDFSLQAKKAKDVSAAGVLVTSLFAILIGILIFLPKILKIFSNLYK
ncbi:MAG: diacylglycerol kinase family protein [Pelolinea sp.]|nr:diacylglycerol kinase family protein [Pelolinea sp.]